MAPEVTVLSPTDGRTYSNSDLPIQLQYQIIEEYNYSLTVFLNTLDIGNRFNGSKLDEILTSGIYTIRIEAVDCRKFGLCSFFSISQSLTINN